MKLSFQNELMIKEYGEIFIIIIPTIAVSYKDSVRDKSLQIGISFLIFSFSLELTFDKN